MNEFPRISPGVVTVARASHALVSQIDEGAKTQLINPDKKQSVAEKKIDITIATAKIRNRIR